MAEPHIHFKGRPGEQATMFLPGSCGNTPEFKPFADRAVVRDAARRERRRWKRMTCRSW